MKYSFSDIIKTDKSGIYFSNGHQILFESCKNEFNKLHNTNTNCVAQRDITARPPYFEFSHLTNIHL